MTEEINKKKYKVNSGEFKTNHHDEYNNLIIKDKLGEYERIVSLLCEISLYPSSIFKKCALYNPTHGGFIPINCSSSFEKIILLKVAEDHKSNIVENCETHGVTNIVWSMEDQEGVGEGEGGGDIIIFTEDADLIDKAVFKSGHAIIVTTSKANTILMEDKEGEDSGIYTEYVLSNTHLSVYVPKYHKDTITEVFHYYIDHNDKILYYDNLIHLCIMVKNGGELFEQMLLRNLNTFDRWTILDTGSTDGTIDAIKRILVGKKKGQLYEEPFINFRDSRNRCLELAGKTCKYNMMLDDTYVVEGDVRSFLNEIRGDQFGDSYSLTVKSHDVEYISNRITKTEKNLRYIYTMHEVIQDKDNTNVRVPENRAIINDLNNDYMMNRSNARKEYDLKCLYEMLEEYPDEPRHLFYLGQTYKMLENFEKAAEYYYKRAFFHVAGFDQEKFDALFEFTRISIYQLNKPWKEFEKYYKLCMEWQPTRPEGSYFLGIHYYIEGDHATAFNYFKKTYEIGYPSHQQYSLKPTLSFHFTPYYLSTLCYEFRDFKLGLDSAALFLQRNKPTDEFYNLMMDWYKIYDMLNRLPPIKPTPTIFSKPILCIVADGGFTKWTGKNILTTGVGGSETWVIETARYINKLANFEVIVFCNCEQDEIFEGVKYLRLSRYLETISEIKIEHCIISRFSEYVPATIEGHVENIHLILHDLQLSGNVIPIHPKIKNILCLTEWHKEHFLEIFPQFSKITRAQNYGIDFAKFLNDESDEKSYIKKRPYSFIYSSFPNRGLSVVLNMWPKIVERYPQAILNIFTDVNNKWANDFYPDELKEIRETLDSYKLLYPYSVVNHGWVDKKTLANYWKQSEIWLYPCKFKETFCLTALEAAITKTLAITNDLAALRDTVGDRGIIIPGDASWEGWQDAAFKKICEVFDNRGGGGGGADTYIDKNYQWALERSWEKRTRVLLNKFILKPQEQIPEYSVNPNNDEAYRADKIELTITEILDNPLKEIDKIFFINLAEREDRRKHFMNQVKKANIPEDKVERFEAINGDKYNFSDTERDMFKCANYLYMPTKSRVMGNQLSHFRIFEEMIKREYKYIIVCQDDAVFKEYFTSYIHKLMSDIPQDAEIIHFGFHKYAVRDIFLPWDLSNKGGKDGNDDEIAYKIINKSVCKLRPDFNALYNANNSTGYILTLKGAKNYVEHIRQFGFKYATDCDVNDYLINKDIYYGTRTVLATTQPTFGSDVFENIYNSETLSNEHKLTINNDYLNYMDMYNWTNDLPENTEAKLTFVRILSNFIKYNSCEILEIGTFAGTSVIGMLQYLPNAMATTIDRWESYEEKECSTDVVTDSLKNIENRNVETVFYENIGKAGFKDKVTAIKGDSAKILVEMVKTKKMFDFIYVDGSHKCLDCYMDCLLGWELLNNGGIMGIDDYLYKISATDDLENVKRGVDHFLEKIRGHYVLLVDGYRLFIKKIDLRNTAKYFLDMRYDFLCKTPSDINEHLPTLYKYAMECDSIIELGVRGCVSSWALLKGLRDNNNKKEGKLSKSLFLNDIEKCEISDLVNMAEYSKIDIGYEWINDLKLNTGDKRYDMTFIDTWHVYGQLKRELRKFGEITNKYIILHDTTVDAEKGETLRLGLDSNKQSEESGFPVEEIECGLRKAVDEFIFTTREWRVKEKFENNNGLTVLERIFQK